MVAEISTWRITRAISSASGKTSIKDQRLTLLRRSARNRFVDNGGATHAKKRFCSLAHIVFGFVTGGVRAKSIAVSAQPGAIFRGHKAKVQSAFAGRRDCHQQRRGRDHRDRRSQSRD